MHNQTDNEFTTSPPPAFKFLKLERATLEEKQTKMYEIEINFRNKKQKYDASSQGNKSRDVKVYEKSRKTSCRFVIYHIIVSVQQLCK